MPIDLSNGLFRFEPAIKVVGRVEVPSLSVDMIHSETMLFSSDWFFARANGGPITKAIMKAIPADDVQRMLWRSIDKRDYNVVIDTRCHMLMAGMLPAIGGWHCDDFPRDETYSQPDLTRPDSMVQHYTATLSTHEHGVSNTLFLDSPIEIGIDPEKVWKSVHLSIEDQEPEVTRSTDGNILWFNQDAIHKAEVCRNPGWRYFFRLSFTPRKPQNIIRRQVQVYLPEAEGW